MADALGWRMKFGPVCFQDQRRFESSRYFRPSWTARFLMAYRNGTESITMRGITWGGSEGIVSVFVGSATDSTGAS